jgi:hypothetical protein
MKYITLDNKFLYPFDPRINHKDFLATIASPDQVCTGAGFIKIEPDGGPVCYGRSESLDIDSNPERDNFLIEFLFATARKRVG